MEATIKVHVVEGSTHFRARFTAQTAGIDEDVVLLDSGEKKVVIGDDDDDGGGRLVALQRRVIVVEEKGRLILRVEASEIGNEESVMREVNIRPRWLPEERDKYSLDIDCIEISSEIPDDICTLQIMHIKTQRGNMSSVFSCNNKAMINKVFKNSTINISTQLCQWFSACASLRKPLHSLWQGHRHH
uniref:DUF6598 domain-containing protein n=1 Tax=Leersia perrieri TaxID=77586 RepID=A0A0D9XXD5_9ORYZ